MTCERPLSLPIFPSLSPLSISFSSLLAPPRWGTKPDGVCAVVGAMGSGFQNNTTGDVIATMDDLSTEKSLQHFWEVRG